MAAPKLREVKKLADSRAVFEIDVPLAELPDFPLRYLTGGAPVHAQLAFGREQGCASVQVQLQAELIATCQRCLGSMPLRVECRSAVLIVESERQAETAPAGWETFLASEGRFAFEALVGEELLLALPIVAVHGPSQCPSPGAETDGPAVGARANSVPLSPSAAPVTMTRPFADLRVILERAAENEADNH